VRADEHLDELDALRAEGLEDEAMRGLEPVLRPSWLVTMAMA
jgi:hypothetical protein